MKFNSAIISFIVSAGAAIAAAIPASTIHADNIAGGADIGPFDLKIIGSGFSNVYVIPQGTMTKKQGLNSPLPFLRPRYFIRNNRLVIEGNDLETNKFYRLNAAFSSNENDAETGLYFVDKDSSDLITVDTFDMDKGKKLTWKGANNWWNCEEAQKDGYINQPIKYLRSGEKAKNCLKIELEVTLW